MKDTDMGLMNNHNHIPTRVSAMVILVAQGVINLHAWLLKNAAVNPNVSKYVWIIARSNTEHVDTVMLINVTSDAKNNMSAIAIKANIW
jgi:hypothetical protein